MKWRNSKERELLANGGSRDQTLPNKNNPNPDLSDAKCDRLSVSPSPPPVGSKECNILTLCQTESSTNFFKPIDEESMKSTIDMVANQNVSQFDHNSIFHRQLLNNFDKTKSRTMTTDQRLHFDEFDDSNTDSDEEISVT